MRGGGSFFGSCGRISWFLCSSVAHLHARADKADHPSTPQRASASSFVIQCFLPAPKLVVSAGLRLTLFEFNELECTPF